MADPIRRYTSQKAYPVFQAPSLAGHQAGVTELGRQASLMGQMAGQQAQSAQTWIGVRDQAYAIGADLARQRGQQRDVTPQRDENGHLIPVEHTATIRIEEKEYQQRQAQAWSRQAQVDYRVEAARQAKTYRDNPEGFVQFMEDYRGTLLGNAPDSVKANLDASLQQFSNEMADGLQTNRIKVEDEAHALAVQRNGEFLVNEIRLLEARDALRYVEIDGKRRPSPQLLQRHQEVFDQLESLPAHSRVPEQTRYADKITMAHFQGMATKLMTQVYNVSDDPTTIKQSLLTIRDNIENDRVTVIGYGKDGLEGGLQEEMTYSQLPDQSRRALDAFIDDLERDLMDKANTRESFEINTYLSERVASRIQDAVSSQVSLPSDLERTIARESYANGVMPEIMIAMAHVESGMKPGAKAPTSMVGGDPGRVGQGLLQVTPNTWKYITNKYFPGMEMSPWNPEHNAAVAGKHAAEVDQMIDVHFPGITDPVHRMRLHAAGHYMGPGDSSTKSGIGKLKRMGVDPTKPPHEWTWQGKLPSEYKKAPPVAEHVAKVEKQFANVRGLSHQIMQGVEQDILNRWGNNPMKAMQIMGHVMRLYNQANSFEAATKRSLYHPPLFDDRMVKNYVGASWNKYQNPVMPGSPHMAYDSTVANLDPGNPEQRRIIAEMQRQAQSSIRSGQTANQRALMESLVAHPGMSQSWTPSDMEKASAAAPPDELNPQGGRIAAPFKRVKELLGPKVKMSSEKASDLLYQRYTSGGRLVSGRIGQELVDYAGAFLENVSYGPGNISPGHVSAGINFFRRILDTSEYAQPLPGVEGRGPASQKETMHYLTRGIGAPGGRDIKQANAERALNFLMANQEKFVNGDPEASQDMRRILNGAPPSYAKRFQSSAVQEEIDRLWREQLDNGFADVLDNLLVRIPNADHVDARAIYPHVLQYMARNSGDYGSDEFSVALKAGVEWAMNNNMIGFSSNTFSPALHQDAKREILPGEPTFVVQPVERYLPPPAFAPKPVYDALPQTVKDPTTGQEYDPRLATVDGVLQAWVEESGQELDIAAERAKGNIKFNRIGHTMLDGDTVPILQAMMRVDAPGSDIPQWRGLITIDTSEMVALGRQPAVAEALDDAAASVQLSTWGAMRIGLRSMLPYSGSGYQNIPSGHRMGDRIRKDLPYDWQHGPSDYRQMPPMQ